MKTALITGITGQDGSYLAEFLLKKGYAVHGIIRRASVFNTARIHHLYTDPHDPEARLHLHYGDATDAAALRNVLESVEPCEVYHLAAQSHVGVSFQQPLYTGDVGAMGTLRLIEAIRDYDMRTGRNTRFYNAGSSEMFGASPPPQDESTQFYPRSPYAVAKVAAFHYTRNYREAYGMYAANGILFNHESPRRGETFVTRKITRAVTRIHLGLQDHLYLGNLDAKRDWGFAGDYVEAMWMMLQHDHPDDFVVATGSAYSVQDFAVAAFEILGMDWEKYVRIDPNYFRPTEVDYLLGDASKARDALGWKPRIDFERLVSMMVASDLTLAQREKVLLDAGHDAPVSRTDL